MTSLRIVALDLAPAASGIAYTHDRHGRPALGCQTVSTGLWPLHKRIDEVWRTVVVAVRCQPHLVVVEGTFGRMGGSDVPIHYLRGVILQWLWSRGIPYVDVAPATLKVWATGSGATRGENKVEKPKVRAAIVATYGRLLSIDPKDGDQCDAVALMTMGLAAYGQPLAEVPADNRRALKVPEWPAIDPSTGVATCVAPAPVGAKRSVA